MKPVLTKEAHEELKEILQKQFCRISPGFPEEEIEDLGITLLNLTAIAIKRDIRMKKEQDFKYFRFICYNEDARPIKTTNFSLKAG